MALNKNKRMEVYAKYEGCCAYCGKKIAYKDMQVDHIVAKSNGGTNDIANLLPSCSICNSRKATYSLNRFREEIKKLLSSNPVKFLLAYGLIQKANKNKKVKFYFETRKSN